VQRSRYALLPQSQEAQQGDVQGDKPKVLSSSPSRSKDASTNILGDWGIWIARTRHRDANYIANDTGDRDANYIADNANFGPHVHTDKRSDSLSDFSADVPLDWHVDQLYGDWSCNHRAVRQCGEGHMVSRRFLHRLRLWRSD